MKTPTNSFLARLLDIIGPRRCVICGSRLAISEQYLCACCNRHLPRTGFYQSPEDNLMARMLWGRIPVKRCIALYYHEARSQAGRLVYDFKYHDAPELARMMGRMMAEECMQEQPLDEEQSSIFDGVTLLLPVPLTKQRQRKRGYNQSVEIAKGIADVTHLPIETKALRRITFQGSQTQKGKWERNENVEGAFELVDGSRLEGQHVLIIDDVMTTGATITACAQEILQAKDVTISVLTLCLAKS